MLVDDFSGSVMGDHEVDLPTRAFVELEAKGVAKSLLLRWFDRAISMATAEEVFTPLEASG